MTFRNDVCSKARVTELEEQREWHCRHSEMLRPRTTSGLDSLTIHTRKLGLTVMRV